MRVLFILWSNPGDSVSPTLSDDLAKAFSYQGHTVTVVTPLERKYKKPTQLVQKNEYNILYVRPGYFVNLVAKLGRIIRLFTITKILYVRTGNFFNLKTKSEKIITIFKISKTLLENIKRYLADQEFDLIISRTPFLEQPKLIHPLREHFNCPAYLLLYDIFPEGAWDLGIIKSKIIYNFLKKREEKILAEFSVIWCISPGNAKYMLEHYKSLTAERVEWLYNYGFIEPALSVDREKIRESMGYANDDIISVFGGNMGLPQKLENMLLLAKEALVLIQAKFLFIGVGTEKERIKKLAKKMKLHNVRFIDYLPREQYDLLAASCDIGLVSLDERFTVPNFPSKTTDYFKVNLPILASLDKS